MKFALLLATTVFCARTSFAVTVDPIQPLGTRVALTLLVQDEGVVMDELVELAEANGGYMKSRKPLQLVVRIPLAALEKYVNVTSSFGLVREKSLQSPDLSRDKAILVAELIARETFLKEYLATMQHATSHEDLKTIGEETTRLIEEIESRRGRMRLMEHEMRYALVDIVFQKRNRSPLRPISSPAFEWLKTVDINHLLADFGRN